MGLLTTHLYLQNRTVDTTEREEATSDTAVSTVAAVKYGAERRLISLHPP